MCLTGEAADKKSAAIRQEMLGGVPITQQFLSATQITSLAD
jgi:hypothetical protein